MVATDNVAVKVKDEPAFSAILVADVARVTVGAVVSLSVMVMVTACVPLSLAPPPETPDTEMPAVSFPSKIESSVGSKVTVPVVLPALIVISDTVPKSVPSVPVPPVPSRDTVTSWKVAVDAVAVRVIVLSEFSSIDDDAVANVTVGALSLSVIVIVTACGVPCSVTPVFPETPLIEIVAVSLDVAS